MKTFKEFLSSTDSVANLTEATVTNDGSVKSLLMMLRNDPKVVELCERITQEKFDPESLKFKIPGNTNEPIPVQYTPSNFKMITRIDGIGSNGLYILAQNQGELELYYGDKLLIDRNKLIRLFTYFDGKSDTLEFNPNGPKYLGVIYTHDSATILESYKLFDMEDPKVFAAISDKKLQTVRRATYVEYKVSSVIPAGMPKNIVQTVFDTVVDILEGEAKGKPVPKFRDPKADAKLSKDFEQFRKLFSELEDTFLEITKSESLDAPSQSEINKTSAALVAIKTQIVGGRVYGR